MFAQKKIKKGREKRENKKKGNYLAGQWSPFRTMITTRKSFQGRIHENNKRNEKIERFFFSRNDDNDNDDDDDDDDNNNNNNKNKKE